MRYLKHISEQAERSTADSESAAGKGEDEHE